MQAPSNNGQELENEKWQPDQRKRRRVAAYDDGETLVSHSDNRQSRNESGSRCAHGAGQRGIDMGNHVSET